MQPIYRSMETLRRLNQALLFSNLLLLFYFNPRIHFRILRLLTGETPLPCTSYLLTTYITAFPIHIRFRNMMRTFGCGRPLLRCSRAAQSRITYGSRFASNDADEFMQTTNASYMEEMYDAWRKDPSSVHASWRAYFGNLDAGVPTSRAFQTPPNLALGAVESVPQAGNAGGEVLDHLKAQMLVRAYQVRGHFRAKVDPLERELGYNSNRPTPKEFTLSYYGWSEKDLERTINLGPGILPGFEVDGKVSLTLRELIDALERTYCSTYGVQYMHIPNRDACDWIRAKVEIPVPYNFSKDEKRRILDRFMWATIFEQFLSTKFPNDKRFGLEGGESMVPGMKELIDAAVDGGIEYVVAGMPHRGRLNVLSNVVRKPHEEIFHEFHGSATVDEGSGDVKYHLGMNYQRPTTGGKKVTLSLVANPSHLEAEDPVVEGQARAVQDSLKDQSRDKAMAVLLHGDAAVAAQGVVYETMGTHLLKNYTTGGTVHVIVNNQIGFTTDPRSGRSTPYPSDFAKTMDVPVFHVNADDVEAVVWIFRLAAEWRARFKRDIVIDMFCYRKYGHNETDQPAFTQPMMYDLVSKKRPALEMYCQKLVAEGTFTEQEIKEHRDWIWATLETSFDKSKTQPPAREEQWVGAPWKDFKTSKELAEEVLPHEPTYISEESFKEIGHAVSSWPDGFNVHRNLQRILKNRGKAIDQGEGIDWSTGEALAFGSLLKEGFNIRVSGQDVERGTFSQRHAVLHDQKTGETVVPLKSVAPDPDNLTVTNSHLSEYGVLGFEYGYSLFDPRNLVMWEAQFGDFANTAQVIIDQFIAAGETKWLQRSGIVMSLPHGYDGQGPEHSSARIERYLLLGNEDSRYFPTSEQLERQHQDANMAIAYPSTPANLFHLLRRQMRRQFRKPLILFFSKALLRHPLARSSIDEFISPESGFEWVIEDKELGKSINDREGIRRIVICSGQVYATLYKTRSDRELKDVAFVKVEQYHPFPFEKLRDLIDSYPSLEDIVWCQEEPLNAGAWSYIQPRLQVTIDNTQNYNGLQARYAGREPSASVAAGTKSRHLEEESAFVTEALRL